MSFLNKAKILFADRNLQYDSQRKEQLLSPEEEKAIITEMKNKGELKELNRLNIFLNISGLIMAEARTCAVSLELALSNINTHVIAERLYKKSEENLERYKYLTSKKNKEGRLSDELEQELEEETIDIWQREVYSYTIYSDNSNNQKKKQLPEPHPRLQRRLADAFRWYKNLKKIVYMTSYLEKKGEMKFLSAIENLDLEGYKKQIEDFEHQNGALKILRSHKALIKAGYYRRSGFSDSTFEPLLSGNSLLLTEEDMEDARNTIERSLHNF